MDPYVRHTIDSCPELLGKGLPRSTGKKTERGRLLYAEE
jgi:hypothetical protein